MAITSQSESEEGIRAPQTRKRGAAFAWILLFAAGFALRAYHIKELPLQFHPIRQYRSAFIARWHYIQNLESVPAWEKKVAELSREREGTLEPPVLEHIAVFGYRRAGKEHLWIPRLISSAFWLIGGVFLYGLAAKVSSPNAALFSTAFYLLDPYAIFASRSFQPDSMMVMLLVISLYFIFVDREHPSIWGHAIAAAASGLAILIKPPCLFMIFGAFMALAFSGQGFTGTVKSRTSWAFAFIALLPALTFYLHGIAAGGRLRYQAEGAFFPQLFLTPSYWEGWARMIDKVVGATPFIVALLGIALLREALGRALLAGLWSGYLVFGLVFNYHIHTHDYYSLPLVPIVALSLAPVADALVERLRVPPELLWRWTTARAAVLVCAAGLAVGHYLHAIWAPLTQVDRDPVKISEEIGERIGHSTRTLFLSYADGLILEYHGGLYGIPWPQADDLRVERLWGEPPRTVEQRFEEMARTYSPEYFIVSDMDQFRAQPALREFLARNYPLLGEGRGYLIFDLRKKLEPPP